MLRTKLPFFLAYARGRQQPIFIEYIESTGTQWLDTGLYLDSYRIVIEAQGTETPPNRYSILCSHLRDYAGNALFAYSSGVWGLQASASTTASIFEKTKLDATFDIVGGFPHAVLTINGETTEYQRTSIPPSPRHNIEIFNAQASEHADKEFVGRLYGFQIYDSDGILLMDAKPCLHPQTFEACMYDTVSKQYLYNKGTGSFVPAPRFVEYIQSTGTQWIDTNYIPTLDDEIIADLQYIATDSDSGDKMFFGNQAKDSSLSCIFVEQYIPSYRWYVRFGTLSSRNYTVKDIEKTERITITINKTRFSTSEGTNLAFSNIVELNQTPLTIFNQKSLSGANRTSKLKLWSFIVTRNGNTMMDLRPCLRGNTPCMFDMVTGTYFYNQGTGEFIAGGEIA